MTERNFKQELFYSQYIDMENGQDTETIDTLALIELLQEMNERIEQLEKDNMVIYQKK